MQLKLGSVKREGDLTHKLQVTYYISINNNNKQLQSINASAAIKLLLQLFLVQTFGLFALYDPLWMIFLIFVT